MRNSTAVELERSMSHLALARGIVDTESRVVGLGGGDGGSDAAELADRGAGGRGLLEVDQRRARRAVHAH